MIALVCAESRARKGDMKSGYNEKEVNGEAGYPESADGQSIW
ncbi:hypothetical protein HCH_05995 [Hahella chejuensis KCTC 2396]|uniref:Uncharacterized protein n=1 Tax=Hahella chejuensis (strain KCTC 2396) TaxID=349521 RepID=Q2S9M9_HAHCH|nr:hypothetical protein HCH_05995 [Hahella chejuensis KCTC 2396]